MRRSRRWWTAMPQGCRSPSWGLQAPSPPGQGNLQAPFSEFIISAVRVLVCHCGLTADSGTSIRIQQSFASGVPLSEIWLLLCCCVCSCYHNCGYYYHHHLQPLSKISLVLLKSYYEATSPLLSLLSGARGGVLIHAQDSAQLSGMYGERQCKERVEGLMVQKFLLQCCQGSTCCVPRSRTVSLNTNLDSW